MLTSVLLGGLIAPLSHFAYMAVSDHYDTSAAAAQEMAHGHGHEHKTINLDGPGLDADHSVDHLECPYAAFFLSQASAVSSDDAGLALTFSSTTLTAGPVATLTATSVHISPIRGPPGLLA